MAELHPDSPSSPASPAPRPKVRLELLYGLDRPRMYEIPDAGFLVGSVPGCDLRLPDPALPPVLCLIAAHNAGLSLRTLAQANILLVNGKAPSTPALAGGDRLTIGPVELLVHVQSAADAKRLPRNDKKKADQPESFASPYLIPADPDARVRELDNRQRKLDEQASQLDTRQRKLEEETAAFGARQQKFDEQTAELETDRVIWYGRRDEFERENQLLEERKRELDTAQNDLQRQTQTLAQERADLARFRHEVDAQAERLDGEQKQVLAMRQEIATLRQQLHDRYNQRRDRLAGLQEAVSHAAAKVQERKRQLEVEIQLARAQRELDSSRQAQLEARIEELDNREATLVAQLDARAAKINASEQTLAEQNQLLEAREQDLQSQQANWLAQCQARDAQHATERDTLKNKQIQYQADLVHLERRTAKLEELQKQIQARADELDNRQAKLGTDALEIENQAKELETWQNQVRIEAGQVSDRKADLDKRETDLNRRNTALEEQQGLLAVLRTRLERLREDIRREEQALTQQRSRQVQLEAELHAKVQEIERSRLDLDESQFCREEQNRLLDERMATVEASLAETRPLREKLAAEEDRLNLIAAGLETKSAEQAEQTRVLQGRMIQLQEMQERLAADRQALRNRETALAEAEPARETLQDQLRRRAEALSDRQRYLAEKEQQLAQADTLLVTQRQEAEVQAANLERLQVDLSGREIALHRHIEHLKHSARQMAAHKKQLAEWRRQWQSQQQARDATLVQARAEFETFRLEAVALQAQLPEWQGQTELAAQHLARARQQLRDHLAELHGYARQSQEDLESLRAQVQAEAEQVRQQYVGVRHARDEHRLAVVAFRQQLIEWQGQVAAMRQALTQDETRLERRQAEVDEQVRQVGATSARLARQAENLQAQERDVIESRDVVQRHLADMREWYRRKLRELTERYSLENGAGDASDADENAVRAAGKEQTGEPERSHGILALTGAIDPGDRQLGDLLRSLDLVEADTLQALFVEARKQRQSLRQVLLASGYVTLYQLALIEAGNLDGLMLGPVRVMDRIQVTPQEAVYLVLDPRRVGDSSGNGEALATLRHLAEAEMQVEGHPSQFRDGFQAAAAIRHVNLATTLEVLDINGRPAALQEWVVGLPGSDWPSLASVPGVLLRLLNQAALGLHAAHQAGLVHGHLHSSLFVLTAEGILKLCGLGEPMWLDEANLPAESGEQVPPNDVHALGQLAMSWATPRASGREPRKAKLPEALQVILKRLIAEKPEQRYPDAAALLGDLDRVASEMPSNPEAWERLVRHVRNNSAAARSLRQSA